LSVAGASPGLPEAAAHDAMVGSTPNRTAPSVRPPDSVELEFSGIPRDDFNTVALSRDGEVLVTGEPDDRRAHPDPGHPRTTWTCPDGEYTVGYQITSSDGHATRGSYTFTLDTGAGAAGGSTGGAVTGEAPAEGESGDGQGLPSWATPVMAIAGVIVVLGALVLAVARFRNLSSDDS
jgi:methionine-rich copper-binding protein CopC